MFKQELEEKDALDRDKEREEKEKKYNDQDNENREFSEDNFKQGLTEIIENNENKQKNEYIKNVYNQINNTNSLENLKKTFDEVVSQKNTSSVKLQNFDNNINKIRNSLNNINEMLSLSSRKNMLDKLTSAFINKNKPIFGFADNKLYSLDNMKSNVLYNFYQENSSRQVVSDVIKVFMNNENVPAPSYQMFDAKLKTWLADFISQNYGRVKNEDKKSNKNKEVMWNSENNGNFENQISSIPSLGYDNSFFTQMTLVQNRKRTIEKSRRDELLLLDRKYGMESNREDRFQRLNKASQIKEKDGIYYKDTKLDDNIHSTYEDKMYSLVNVFYNIKYNKMVREEKELIDKYKIRLKDYHDKQKNKEIKTYLSSSLNIKAKLNPIKEWTASRSVLMGNNTLDLQNVLKATSEKAKDMVVEQQYLGKDSFISKPKIEVKSLKNTDLETYDEELKKPSLFSSSIAKRMGAMVLKEAIKKSKENKADKEKTE